MEYQTVIIDDEALNIDYLSGLLEIYCPDIHVVATATNVEEGIRIIIRHKPRILFLDIEIHDKTAFDILNAVDEYAVQVILVTAHDKYAVRAFKYAVIDYILKPINVEELIDAIKRCKKRIVEKDGDQPKKCIDYHTDYLSIHHKDHIELLHLNEIVHLDASGSYTEIHTLNNKKQYSTKSLKENEEHLPVHHFIRVHASHIINRNHISKYIRGRFGSFLMINGFEIPISPARKQIVSEILNL